MAAIKSILFSLALCTLVQCNEKSQVFSTYSVDPLREAIVKNGIAASVEFVIVNNIVGKTDSISFDDKGNIVSRINIGGWSKSEMYYTYDSLNRLVHETQKSDVYGEYCIQYDPCPSNREVISYTYRCDHDSSLLLQEVIKYDDRLQRILQRLEINPSNDTTVILYRYNGDKIVNESREGKGQQGFQTEYFYREGRLIRIERTLTDIVDDNDHLSEATGLIDSTIRRSSNDTIVIYYKYYKHGAVSIRR